MKLGVLIPQRGVENSLERPKGVGRVHGIVTDGRTDGPGIGLAQGGMH